MDVSIIIVNYNTCSLTLDCIKSVKEKTRDCSYEIIVVDNASNDDSKQVLSAINDITYIYLEKNLGFGGGNNEGIKKAKGRNIFLLNSDTLLINDAVSILSHTLDSNEAIGVCGGNLYDVNNEPTNSYEMHLPSFVWELNKVSNYRLFRYIYRKNRYFNTKNRLLKVGYISGADMMIRKSALDKVGMFDTHFFMYYEETELTYRIKKAGYSCISNPEAKIIHLEGGSQKDSCDFNERKFRWMTTSYFYYLNKCYSPFKRKLLKQMFKIEFKRDCKQYGIGPEKRKEIIEQAQKHIYKKDF